ncbi:hypothetical protein [Methylorubrum sp. SB2]|uniref:hypothetical protein n=1 Tax=Methylorubrum subtropicum TaxID=3138812 RepID=UPI00313B119D
MNTRNFLLAGFSIVILACGGLAAHVLKPAEGQTVSMATPHELINGFARPDIFRALYDGDLLELNNNRVENFLYMTVVVAATSASDAFYRMNQAELLLDPRLEVVMTGKALTDGDVLRYVVATGLNTGLGTLVDFMKSRSNSIANKTVNPVGEITAVNKALIEGSRTIAFLQADAGGDAKKLMLLAQTDPHTFNKIYATIREFVYRF